VGPSNGGGQGGGQSVSPAARGVVLLGLAVIVGIVGLQVLDDSASTSGEVTVSTTAATAVTTTTKASTSTTAAAGSVTTTTKASTSSSTTTTLKVRKNSEVRVKVYNASGVQGAATNMSNKLKSLGYNTQGTDNLTPTQNGNSVSCHSGFDNEAKVLADSGVGNGATVKAFPSPAPSGSSDVDCIVILGTT
jgi:hypothetical protein